MSTAINLLNTYLTNIISISQPVSFVIQFENVQDKRAKFQKCSSFFYPLFKNILFQKSLTQQLKSSVEED